jgi:CRISPR/Cas system-associated exonuclease Cas4 (RecB family)
MPGETDKIKAARREEVKNDNRPLPYISKSRLKEYVTCPMKFYFTYVLGRRGDATFYMARGTEVHRTFENFYENVQDDLSAAFNGKLRNYLPGMQTGHGRRGAADWADHITPFIGNFLKFERRRRLTCLENAEAVNKSRKSYIAPEWWNPVGIEEEGWIDYDWNDPEWDVPLMGFADLVVASASLPDEIVEANYGVTILDFKTGSVPDPQYRDEGIYLEQEFYATIFEQTMDREVTGVAAYYPKSDTTIGAELSNDRREFMDQKLHEMVALSFHAEKEWFPIDEQPLCAWSNAKGDGMCDHYAECDSEWGLDHYNGPTYQHAIDAKPDGFLEDKAEKRDVGGLYEIDEASS